MLRKKPHAAPFSTLLGAMAVLCGLCLPNRAAAVDPALAAAIASSELASPEVQAAATLAEPIAQQARAFKHLADAARETIDPLIFVGRTIMLVPQYARPARAAWTILKTPVQIVHPVKAMSDLAGVPGDIWAPFEATGKILCDTPRLLGPIRAVSSLSEFVACTARNVRSFPATAE